MESRNEKNIISRLQNIFLFALKLPVRIVYQDEDSGTSAVISQRCMSNLPSGSCEKKNYSEEKRRPVPHFANSQVRQLPSERATLAPPTPNQKGMYLDRYVLIG